VPYFSPLNSLMSKLKKQRYAIKFSIRLEKTARDYFIFMFSMAQRVSEDRKNCELQGGSLAPLFCTLKVSKLFGKCCDK
jgi:hypothetical protein